MPLVWELLFLGALTCLLFTGVGRTGLPRLQSSPSHRELGLLTPGFFFPTLHLLKVLQPSGHPMLARNTSSINSDCKDSLLAGTEAV